MRRFAVTRARARVWGAGTQLAWLVLALVAACGHDAPPPKEQTAELGAGTVARVGSVAIPASLVADVVRVRALSPRAALDGLVDDALAAEGAHAVGLDAAPGARWPGVAAQARLVATRIQKDARANGPPTDAEIAERTALHWRKLDVPEGVRVVHVVVLYRGKKASPENIAAARATLDTVSAAVAHAATAADFESLARAVPVDQKTQLKVESLSFTVDGRSLDSQNVTIEQPFVAVAVALHSPGDRGRAETSYGQHLIQLVARLPEQRVPLAERRVLLEAEALATRAHKAYEATLQELRARYPVQVSTAADALMQTVSLEHP